MNPLVCSLIGLLLLALPTRAQEPQVLLRETFQSELSKDWFWGLGTWAAKDGVMRGFESGKRRHGPMKMRRLEMQDATAEFDFRLEGKASFAGIIFNGSQERGHLVHLVMSTDGLRILAHPKKGESQRLAEVVTALAPDVWHRVKLTFTGPIMRASVDGISIQAEHACIAETKQTFGLGGDSGGPEGEKAGALEFRNLTLTKP